MLLFRRCLLVLLVILAAPLPAAVAAPAPATAGWLYENSVLMLVPKLTMLK